MTALEPLQRVKFPESLTDGLIRQSDDYLCKPDLVAKPLFLQEKNEERKRINLRQPSTESDQAQIPSS